MATFGKTTIGASPFSVTLNECDGSAYSLANDGMVSEFWVYCANPDTVNVGFKIGCHTASGNLPVTLMGISDEVILTAGAAAAWRQFPITTPFFLTAGAYSLGHFGYSGTGVTTSAKVYADTPGGNVGSWFTDTYPNLSSTAPTPNNDTNTYSIYAVVADVPRVDYSNFPKPLLRRSA